MPRSVVDLAKLNELDATIRSFDSNTGASMAAYYHSARNLLSQFDAKLNELSITLQRASEALRRCNSIQDSNPMKSCASEEAAFNRAYRRYKECEELVKKARQAIFEYSNYAAEFRKSKNDLCSRASAGLKHVESFVTEFNSNATPNTDNVMSNGIPAVSPSTTSSIPSSKEQNNGQTMGDSSMFIKGGEEIDHVLPKGSPTNPIAIDMESDKLEGLPPVTAPDNSAMSEAAAGILAALAAGGLVFGMREMLLQQKTDEIFEKQYGISRTELLLKSGPKQKEYVAAYNGIYKGLQQEMKEQQKKEIFNQIQQKKEFLTLEERRINELHGEETLFSRELVHDTKIEVKNLENQIASIDDGKKRIVVPSGKTKIGGLSGDGLSFMKEDMSSKERFITVSNLLCNSQVTLTGDNGKEYVFKNEDSDIFFVAHDGSYVKRYMRDFSQGFSDVETSVNLPEINSTGYSNKMTDVDSTLLSVSAEKKYTAEGVRVVNKTYHINQDGSAWTKVVNASIGGEVRTGVSMSYKGAEIGAEVSAARAGLKETYITAPSLKNGSYSQSEYGSSGEANVGLALSAGTSKTKDGTNEIGVKVPFAKFSVVYGKFNLSEKEFPEYIRKQLK